MIYEIQYNIMYREDIVSYTKRIARRASVQRGRRLLHEKESRDEHLLSNSLYLPFWSSWRHINIL